MTQRLLRFIFSLLCVLSFAAPDLFGQQRNPYKDLRTSINTAVYDTIAGVDLDVNESSPQPKHGTLDVTVLVPGGGGDPYVFEVQYIPDPGFIGVDSFVLEYRYASTYPYLIYRGFKVSVMPSMVRGHTDFAVTATGTPVTINVLANDMGAWGPLTVAGVSLVNNGTATVNSNQEVVFTPSPGFSGVAHASYSVCDALNTCQTASVHIGVNNGLPANDTLSIFTNKNQDIAIPLTFNGYTVFQAPAHGIVTLNAGKSFRYAPTTGFTGTDHFVLKTSFNGVNYFKTVNVKVYNVQSPNLMAMDDVRFTPKNQPITFNVRDNDIGNLLVRSWSVPNNFPGTLTGTTGTGNVTFTPNANFSGVATFTYKIGNSSAPALEVATVTIVVDNLTPPTLFPYLLVTPRETPFVVNYKIPYTDFNFVILEEPDHGTLDYYPGVTTQIINGQSVTGNNLVVFTPADDYIGEDDFALLYCAPNGQCQSSKINMEVIEINATDPPFCIADCAWSGDINADGITNNKDLLPLGFCMGLEGDARIDGSLIWYGQYADNWNNPFTGLSHDLKHADTDGNGQLNAADIQGLQYNYNQANNLVPKAFDTGKGLPFSLELLTGDIEIGELVQVAVSLGSAAVPAIDIYGFTFDVTLSQGLIDSGFRMTYLDNSWLNLNAPSIALAQRPYTGRFETAFTRTNGQPASGEGVIANLEFIIIIVEGGGQNERATLTLNPTIMLVDGSTTTGAPITLKLPVKTKDRGASSQSEGALDMLVFPSPAQDVLNISLSGNSTVEFISLLDARGQTVLQQTTTSSESRLNIRHLPAGFYTVLAQTNGGVMAKKVQVVR